jgi:DNA adenine methylase
MDASTVYKVAVAFNRRATVVTALRYAPFKYAQGSHYLVKELLPLVPPHDIYVEVFGGAANLLFAKSPSKIEVYNDINSELVNFFRVLRDDEKYQKLQEKLLLTPYAREEFHLARQPAEGLDEVELARRFFVKMQMSFSGQAGCFSYTKVPSSNPASIYFNRVAMLGQFHERIRNVITECLDFEEVIRRYDSPRTFFFCDPPYIGHTIRSHHLSLEMPLGDHERLVNALLRVQGKVLLLAYRHPIYDKLGEHGWHLKTLDVVLTFTKTTETKDKRQRRERCLWMNYLPRPSSQQITLSDFSEKPTAT